MATRCIYCRDETTGDEGTAHAVPEALIGNDATLPAGSCCDPCNQYMGSTLEPALVSHPIISMYIQFLGLPGKEGKPRKQLGNVGRDEQCTHLTIPIREPTAITAEDGSRSWEVRPRISPQFDSVEFARALHYLAFNVLTVALGPDTALDPQFDGVRTFIRQPAIDERWPYVSWTPTGLDPIREDIDITGIPDAPGHTVGVRLFNLCYLVDLVQSGELGSYVDQALPDDAHYGFPDPEREPLGEKQYRLRIWLDEEAGIKTLGRELE